MKKVLTLSFICLNLMGFSQNNEEVVTVEKSQRVKIADKTQVLTIVPSTLKQAIIAGFKTGNSTLLSTYFAQNIDIALLNKENLYSKSQAVQVLKTFFTEHKPSNFVINHEGQSKQTKYFIGVLTTTNGVFRITINTKSDLISRLTIEKQ